MLPISCVLPVYIGVETDEFTRAFRSIAHQTAPPDEVVVVCDGPVRSGIDEFLSGREGPRLTVVRLEENRGASYAIRAGIDAARNRWIARHDADDIMMPDRLEKQWPVVESGEYAAVGGAICEFVDTPGNIVRVRRLPAEPEQIEKYVTINSPLNNPTVIIDSDAARAVGGIRDILFMEDYDLWARLIAAGYRLRSIDEVLTLQHAPESMFDRRTDPRLASAEKVMQKNLVELGLVSRPRAVANYAARQLFRKLPRPLLKAVYAKLFDNPGALDEPISEVRRWLETGWPGFSPEPADSLRG